MPLGAGSTTTGIDCAGLGGCPRRLARPHDGEVIGGGPQAGDVPVATDAEDHGYAIRPNERKRDGAQNAGAAARRS